MLYAIDIGKSLDYYFKQQFYIFKFVTQFVISIELFLQLFFDFKIKSTSLYDYHITSQIWRRIKYYLFK